MKRFVALALMWVVFACSNSPTMTIGEKVEANYSKPSTYADHRAQQQLFDTPDGFLAYTDTGQGDAIVLMHGVPTSSWLYRKMIPGLQADRRVISLDFLGYGSSDKPKNENGIYSEENHAARLWALLDELDVETFSLVVHDMGGVVGWEMLGMQPQRISNLVVLNTIVSQQGFEHPNMEEGIMMDAMKRLYSGNLTSVAVLDKTFQDLGLTGPQKLSEDECFGYVVPLREGADEAVFSFFASINQTLFDKLERNKSELSGYPGSVFVLWGAKDETLTSAQIPNLAATFSIPQQNIRVYDNNAHFLQEEIPDQLVRDINAFLN